MTEKEEYLISLLEKYPHPNHNGDDYVGCLFCISSAGRKHGRIDEFIRICESNPDVSLDDIQKLIFTKECFPPLEIADDKE